MTPPLGDASSPAVTDHRLSDPPSVGGNHGAPRAADVGRAHPDTGRYTRGAALGEGGMGRVTLARDHELGRDIALKEVAPGLDASAIAAARLRREAWVLGQLEHPSIVPVHDTGTTDDGRFFFTMRVIRGRSLAEVIRGEPDRQARLRWLRHVLAAAEAVAYAHDRGIIHRDLKPQNLMVGAFGETQVIDWGLARRLDEDDLAHDAAVETPADLTRIGALVGTPRYMSPEQARGDEVGRAADVWGLGMTLFELVSGRPALDGPNVESVLARLRRDDLPAPERALPDAPPELVAIIRRALVARPEDRYPSAKELAEDLASYLEGRRVAAHGYTAFELLARLVNAWRAQLIVAAVALALIVVAVALAFARVAAESERAEAARVIAERSASDARRAASEARASLARALAGEALALLERGATPEAARQALGSLALAPSPEARGLVVAALSSPLPRLVEERPLPAGCREVTVGAGVTLCRRPDSLARLEPDGRARWERRLAATDATPLGEGRVVAQIPGQLVELDAATGRELGRHPERCNGPNLEARPDAGVALAWTASCAHPLLADRSLPPLAPCGSALALAVALAPDGARWAAACKGGDVAIWAVGEAAPERVFHTTFAAFEADPTAIAVGSGGDRVALGDAHGRVTIFDGAGRARSDCEGLTAEHVRHLAFAPGAELLAIETDRDGLRLCDVASGQLAGSLPLGDAGPFAFDDGGRLVTTGARLARWAPPRPTALVRRDGVTAAAFAPDGRALAVAHGPCVTVVDADLGRVHYSRRWQDHVVKGLTFDPDGATFEVAAIGDATTTAWALETGDGPAPRTRATARRLATLASGQRVLVPYLGPPRLTQPGEDATVDLPLAEVLDLAATPDLARVALLQDQPRALAVLDAGPAPSPRVVALDPDAVAVAIGDGGDRLYAAHDAAFAVYDADTGDLLELVPAGVEQNLEIAATGDGRFVALGARDGSVRVWERGAHHELRLVFGDHHRRVPVLAFAPDGRHLLTGSWDGSLKSRDLTLVDDALETLEARARGVLGEAFHLAAAAEDAGREP